MKSRELLIELHKKIEDHLALIPSKEINDDEIIMRYQKDPLRPPKGNFQGWVWPMPVWRNKEPVISDGFNRYKTAEKRQHLGVDVMYKNSHPGEKRLPEQTKWFHCPSNTIPMLAMGAGNIWFAGLTGTGWSVLIDHHDWVGFPLITYYTHLSELFIDPWYKGEAQDGNGKPGGQYVYPGFELGFVGNSPKGEDPNHAHVEFQDFSDGVPGGRANRCLDPKPFLICFNHRIIR